MHPHFTLTRHLPVDPNAAYAAWTQPEQVKRWWGPTKGDQNVGVDLDVRPGGEYHVKTKLANGETFDFEGEYREVKPGEKLVFTFPVEDNVDDPSAVTVVFKATKDGTDVMLTQGGFQKDETRKDCEQGWNGALDKLEAMLAKQPGAKS
jgi:uncharacterized protein YndB with AHSA1/START domain